MTLAQQLSLLITRIGDEFKTHVTTMSGNTSGDISGLTTTAKSNIVSAINEVQASAVQAGVDIATLQSTVASIDTSSVIDDATESSSTTFSSAKIVSELNDLKTEILGDAALPTALDTLAEIAAYVEQNRDLIDSLNMLAGDRVATTSNQGLSEVEKTNALTNLGIETLPGSVTTLLADVQQLQNDFSTLTSSLASVEETIGVDDTVGLRKRIADLEASTTDADLAALEQRVSANETNHSKLVGDLGDVTVDLVALFEASLL